MNTAPELGAVDYSALFDYAPELGAVDYTATPVVEAAGAAGAHLTSEATAAGIYAARGAATGAIEALATAVVSSRPIRWIRPRQVLLRPAMTATPMVKPQ